MLFPNSYFVIQNVWAQTCKIFIFKRGACCHLRAYRKLVTAEKRIITYVIMKLSRSASGQEVYYVLLPLRGLSRITGKINSSIKTDCFDYLVSQYDHNIPVMLLHFHAGRRFGC